MRFDKEFYLQDAVTLSKALLGHLLVRNVDGQEIVCRIVETEAYVGPEDKGCHAYQNKRTKRTETMFLPGGHAYIYLIYGMYYCLNVVARIQDIPEAVLIRAVEPLKGMDLIKKNRPMKTYKPENLTNGPGKLCKALKIERELNGCDLIKSNDLFLVKDGTFQVSEIISTKRINIDYAEEYIDKPWRFYIKGNRWVSVNKYGSSKCAL
ncbi:MAG: DNA-3-methyladenine glycosylase [Bacteroidota bacterium]